jgi:POT family proton-dependent oligopeptide transporter
MAKSKYLISPLSSPDMPKGIKYIVGNEAAERFSFYGMKAILAIFLTKYLMDSNGNPDVLEEADARAWVHNFTSAAYFFPILGAIVADWLFGKYRTIISLSLVYCAGHAVLALVDVPMPIEPRDLLWYGLALIAFGSGGIKPCVSAHVGDQFGKQNQKLLSKVFSLFYFSINLGSTISTLLTPLLLKHWGPAWAFGVPGVLMALATLMFWMGRHVFVHIPPSGNHFFTETFSQNGRRAIFNLIPLYLFVAMFWALFDQTASAWVLQAENMNRNLFGWNVLSSQIQAANPILVMILIPVFTFVIYPWLGRYFEVTPLRKIGIGLFLTIPAFAIPAWIEMRISSGATPHIVWQLAAYIVMTAAEVMVSITTLELSYTQAPKKMKSFIMGLYMLSVAVGNKFTALVNEYISAQKQEGVTLLEGANYYWFFTLVMAVTAVLFVLFAQFYRGQTYIQESEQPESEGDD